MREKLRPFGFSYELLLCENGSRDRTVEIGKELEAEHAGVVRMLSVGEPNYGLAMKTGILEARGKIVICDEIDLCDTEFYARALALLASYPFCSAKRRKRRTISSSERTSSTFPVPAACQTAMHASSGARTHAVSS